MLTVNGDRGVVERQLAGGELACPSRGGVLGRWGMPRSGTWLRSASNKCGGHACRRFRMISVRDAMILSRSLTIVAT